MPLNFGAIGREEPAQERTWTSADAILYALGVGASSRDDPYSELAFVTENSIGVEQAVLPTFGVSLAVGPTNLGDYDRAMAVHGEQEIRVHQPIPPSGTVRTSVTVTGIYDKGSGALVATESSVVGTDGTPLVSTSAGYFIRGEGGFGGPGGTASREWARPARDPDHVVTHATRKDQALLYRLSGDRNPLHSDPTFARKAGFEQPILHGLCTYGFVGRALLSATCGSDPARFRSMFARFKQPVMPGDTLSTSIWVDGNDVVFETSTQDGRVVLTNGTAKVD